jgi:hypothetical protein
MLESLPVEQQPIAQQLLRGGIPAVRTALHFERERAREAGRPEPSTEGVLALAESLVSRVKAAEWRDRAEAAIKAGDDLAMRDLRSLVSGSDVARDEASRELVITLREMLERRVEGHRVTWADDVAKSLDQGQVVKALRLSSRPPDASARFSAELATRLRDAASSALSPSTPEDQWLAVLQGVVESPVRRTVKPEGLPENPSPELLEAARQHCGRVPALAPLLGITVPPPPGPVRPNVPVKAPSRRQTRPKRSAAHRTAPGGQTSPQRPEPRASTAADVEAPADGVEAAEVTPPTDGPAAQPETTSPGVAGGMDDGPRPEGADGGAALEPDQLEVPVAAIEVEEPPFEHDHEPEPGQSSLGPGTVGREDPEPQDLVNHEAREAHEPESVATVPDETVATVPDETVATVPDETVATVPDETAPDETVPDEVADDEVSSGPGITSGAGASRASEP